MLLSSLTEPKFEVPEQILLVIISNYFHGMRWRTFQNQSTPSFILQRRRSLAKKCQKSCVATHRLKKELLISWLEMAPAILARLVSYLAPPPLSSQALVLSFFCALVKDIPAGSSVKWYCTYTQESCLDFIKGFLFLLSYTHTQFCNACILQYIEYNLKKDKVWVVHYSGIFCHMYLFGQKAISSTEELLLLKKGKRKWVDQLFFFCLAVEENQHMSTRSADSIMK